MTLQEWAESNGVVIQDHPKTKHVYVNVESVRITNQQAALFHLDDYETTECSGSIVWLKPFSVSTDREYLQKIANRLEVPDCFNSILPANFDTQTILQETITDIVKILQNAGIRPIYETDSKE